MSLESQGDRALGDAWEIGDALAQAWEANADFIARTGVRVQRWLVDHLDPQAGERVLELGAGPGDTGFEVARRLGPEGKLLSTDLSPQMLDVTRRRAAAFGVPNTDFRVMDAQRIEIDDATMDGVVHRFGPMLLPDPDASFREVERVLRDGGRYVAAVFTGPQNNAWMMTTAMSVMQNGIPMPGGSPMDPGAPFSLSDPESLRQRLQSAGFSDMVLEPVPQAFEFADADEAWRRLSSLAGPLAVVISQLEPDKYEAVKATFLEIAGQHRTDDGLVLSGEALCVSAR